MEHTQLVSASDLEAYAESIASESVIPELIWMLVNQSAQDLSVCRIPYGDMIGQPGWDGTVETIDGYHQYVPKGKSYWEIGTGADPQSKATEDFRKRTDKMPEDTRADASYVFVTPRGAGTKGWSGPAQVTWVAARQGEGWGRIIILDGNLIGDWLRDFPAIGKWLLKQMGRVSAISGFTTPAEHWDDLQQLSRISGDPPLPPKLFLVDRDKARDDLLQLFKGETPQLVLSIEAENDADDFIAASLADLDTAVGMTLSNRCIFISNEETWHSMTGLRTPHVFVAHPKLDLEQSGERLHLSATKRGHAVVIPLLNSVAGENHKNVLLQSPSVAQIEATLQHNGYSAMRARAVAAMGDMGLSSLKRQLRGLGAKPPYATSENARQLAQAGLAGRWHAENDADKKAMEDLLGKAYGEWIEIIRLEAMKADTPLSFRDEYWKVLSRGEAWHALGALLSNDDLDRYSRVAVQVLGERDPKFDLPEEERFTAAIHGKKLKHSESLRRGLAETLALIGCRPEALSSCSQGKGVTVAALTVRALLSEADWEMWASLGQLLPLLAEAAPEEFLSSVEGALLTPKESPFNELFAQEGNGSVGTNYMTGLLWALEVLAWHPAYLQRVTSLLGDLAAIDPGGSWANRPANSLTDIFLPWHFQSAASLEQRTVAVALLLKEQPKVGWNVLLSLLPSHHGFTMGCYKPVWRQSILSSWSDKVMLTDYWKQIAIYADMAVVAAENDLVKLAELVDRLPDLPKPALDRVLAHFLSEKVKALSDSQRKPLWEALTDLARKHRRFPDAGWVMPPDIIEKVEEAAYTLVPKSAYYRHQRLFSDRDHELFDEKGSYDAQFERLNHQRQEAVREVFVEVQYAGLKGFALEVANPGAVGFALGQLNESAHDDAILPELLDNNEPRLQRFLASYVFGRHTVSGWPWADNLLRAGWTESQKTNFLMSLPFEHETWRRAEAALDNKASAYWKEVRVLPYGPQKHLAEAAEWLLQNGRPKAALACVHRLIDDKSDISPDLAVRALLGSVRSVENDRGVDQYEMSEVIKWLQETPKANPNDLFTVEWAYLPLLDHRYGGSPNTIERRIASDPAHFCEMLALAFRGKKEGGEARAVTEESKAIAGNAYRLLHGLQIVPGLKPDGVFDGTLFADWLAEVYRRTQESGHYQIAQSMIGQVLGYSPPDPDGLWIHRAIAEALNAKEAEELRTGFRCKLFNQRGIHTFTAGKEEAELAKKYNTMADALEQNGYHRIAADIRSMAQSYERDSARESQRNLLDDRD